MNVFYLDEAESKAAAMLCDQHVVKMILETTQMLCTAHHMNLSASVEMYAPTHENHPSCKWVRSNTKNYFWTYIYLLNLHMEYKERFNRDHGSCFLLTDLSFSPSYVEEGEQTQPPQCMPDKFKRSCSVKAYRSYYINKSYQWFEAGNPMRYNRKIVMCPSTIWSKL